MKEKTLLRQEYQARWSTLWPPAGESLRPPHFAGAGRAAERLRRLPEYRRARTIAILADPVLLQVRVNALGDGKTLLAATPGLKQGLVRITPQMLAIPLRSRLLRGGSLVQAGKPLRPPADRLGKAELLVVPALAVDARGMLLGDGRGLTDLLYALLVDQGVLTPRTPVVVLADSRQLCADEFPAQPWDLGADLVVTPEETRRFVPPLRPRAGLEALPPAEPKESGWWEMTSRGSDLLKR
ncbi:MAG: 5-formyltetrahydrofolate cyclo-ligase [Desulfarculus sp.]|nr:5-formyltetrahydrofolate cyclo-ligase [Desulfarculus sp.]